MAAESQVRLWALSDDYITLNYAWAQLRYSTAGERITDRLGLVHRVAPSVDTYPVGLTISLALPELFELNCPAAAQRRTALQWLEYYGRKQAQLMVFVRGATLAPDGSDVIRNLAYSAIIEELPGAGSATLAVPPDSGELAEFTLLVTEDGTFSNFDSLGSFSAYSPARP